MIFVTTGSQKLQMNRLVKAVDKLQTTISEEIFVQKGWSDYIPVNCRYTDFLDSNEYDKMISECSILITHAGVGTIITGLNAKKPVIVVPRRNIYLEHVDDHQCQIAEAFASKHCVLRCDDVEKLKEYIEKAGKFDFKPYKFKVGNIENTIMNYINIFEK